MRTVPGVLAAILLSLCAGLASAQTPGTITSAVTGPVASRLTTLPQLAAVSMSSVVELTIRWDATTPGVGGPPAVSTALDQFLVIGSRTVSEMPVPERAPQLSEDRLVIVAIDGQGTEVGWQLVKDPAIVRSEQPTAAGELTGQVLRRPRASFLLSLPRREVPILELRVYKPRWTGSAYVLDPLGTVAIPADVR